MKNQTAIAFLPDKKEEAMRALIQRMNKKLWSYQELRRVTKLFNSDLTREEKQKLVGKRFFGKKQSRKKPATARREPRSKSILKENQRKIDDFFGRFLHWEVLLSVMVEFL